MVALVEQTGAVDVEDLVVEVDLASGEVDLLLDFKDLMADYHSQTRPIGATDPFFWQAGEQDWIHLNTIQYLPDSDSLVVSLPGDLHRHQGGGTSMARRPSTGFCGDPRPSGRAPAMKNTAWSPVNDFAWQYGQHSVEYAPAEEEGVCYLRMFNN